MNHPKIGFGNHNPRWVLHIANRPALAEFQHDVFRALTRGEAAEIIKATSNHWRKAFSIMAKISFALFDTGCATWQEYRDTKLLTEEGFESVSFEPFQTNQLNAFSIVCGFAYAEQQLEVSKLIPHIEQPKLLISETDDVIVTPYFDWRQLTNEILATLVTVLQHKLKT